MKLAKDNFFTRSFLVRDPYGATVNCTGYGYETKTTIYDINISDRVAWYCVNMKPVLKAHTIHKAIAKHYGLTHLGACQ